MTIWKGIYIPTSRYIRILIGCRNIFFFFGDEIYYYCINVLINTVLCYEQLANLWQYCSCTAVLYVVVSISKDEGLDFYCIHSFWLQRVSIIAAVREYLNLAHCDQ